VAEAVVDRVINANMIIKPRRIMVGLLRRRVAKAKLKYHQCAAEEELRDNRPIFSGIPIAP
jgi:hypothetical protein